MIHTSLTKYLNKHLLSIVALFLVSTVGCKEHKEEVKDRIQKSDHAIITFENAGYTGVRFVWSTYEDKLKLSSFIGDELVGDTMLPCNPNGRIIIHENVADTLQGSFAAQTEACSYIQIGDTYFAMTDSAYDFFHTRVEMFSKISFGEMVADSTSRKVDPWGLNNQASQ